MSRHAKPRKGNEGGPDRSKFWLLLIQVAIGIWNHF
ncbi:hypothetical protein GA0115234_108863 [Streptomyces sp. DvalAA-43]|jgi:hypothetical protein|nr:hypothetical protein GA0115234_108863 [Streptomyces sp. DvalAA-43]